MSDDNNTDDELNMINNMSKSSQNLKNLKNAMCDLEHTKNVKNTWQVVPAKCGVSGNRRRTVASPTHVVDNKRQKTNNDNRYADLDDDSADESAAATREQLPKPPPIIIPNITNISEMINKFCTVITKNEFKFKTLNDGQVRVMVENINAYRNLIKYLDSCNTVFHTYQIKQDRAYRVVIKNLHHSTSIEDIRNELLEYGHDARNVLNIRNRFTKLPLSMFYVDLEPQVNNKEIYKIIHINNSIVTIEPPHKKNDIVQCHRCQQFGHTKAYCKKPFKCVKCALDHPTTECQKDINIPPKCIHCLKEHTANYKGCLVYKELLGKRANNNSFQATHDKNKVQYDRPNFTHNTNENYSNNHGLSYADVCRNQANNDNKLEKMLEKQVELINTLISMMATLMQKLCN